MANETIGDLTPKVTLNGAELVEVESDPSGTPASMSVTTQQIADLGGSTNPTVVDKTADYSILSEDSGKIFTNEGASGEIELTLPTAAAGLNYKFAVKNSNALKVPVNSGDKIIDKDSNESDVGIIGNTKGDIVKVTAIDDTYWFINYQNNFNIYVAAGTYGFFGGGYYGSSRSNVIDYITLATTTQNATDTGDLTVGRSSAAGC